MNPSAYPRSAWVEVDLALLAANFRLLRADLPSGVRLLYVLKDDAYGLGAVTCARVALAHGVSHLAVFTLGEAAVLRQAGLTAPILLLGERLPEELPHALDLDLETCVGRLDIAQRLSSLGRARGRPVPIHVKINTGMNRFGFSWRECATWSQALAQLPGISFAGLMSHFAQSDELEKTFARTQLARFRECVAIVQAAGIRPALLHHCNSGGTMDLPEAHFDLVRVGLLAHGVQPSAVCRRVPGLKPVLTVKARVVTIQSVEPGDTVGYGMRWQARRPSRIGVLPLGYADGFPRVRNEGHALLHGCRVPIVGGVAMDAILVDLTDLQDARVGDEAVLLGCQGEIEITAQDLATLKRSVTYDLLAGWRARLPRRLLGG